jgi:hypothetical protein
MCRRHVWFALPHNLAPAGSLIVTPCQAVCSKSNHRNQMVRA